MSPPGDRDTPPSEREEERLAKPSSGRLVVIGNFDGVHRGHRAVLESARQEAVRGGLGLCVLTFDPHPAKVLAGIERQALTVTARKVALLKAVAPGVQVEVQHFDRALAALSPREFAIRILRDKLSARVVLVGENFRFGNKRAGDLSTLQELGQELEFEARSEALKGDEQGAFSSTRIRGLLAEGRVKEAADMLGRAHCLAGVVAEGDKRGRTIGVPTANLEQVHELLPQDGVYLVRVFDLSAKGAPFLAVGVANIGGRPTVNRPETVEVHLLDFEGNLYGRKLGVACLNHLRGIEKFESLDALKTQISKDIDAARSQLQGLEFDAESSWLEG